mgnify:FL=1
MSLISLSSKSVSRNDSTQQSPFNFKNFFPQPIIIKPKSQVCLTTFYHFRTEGIYNINSNNNLIGFCFGDRQNNNVMYATLSKGNYEGAELATEIARAMNASNVQQNYLWTATFTEGSAVAIPQTFDEFTLTYENVPTPTEKGGVWSKLSSRNQNGTLENEDTEDEFSSIINLSDDPLPVKLRNGLLLHEGMVRYENIGLSHNHASIDAPLELSPLNMGIVQSAMAVDSANLSDATSFQSKFGDILVQTIGKRIIISTLNQKQGTSGIGGLFATNDRGKVQTIRREFDENFLNTICDSSTDRLSFNIYRVSGNRSWVITCQKSVDNGATYTDITDGQGNNADGRPNVYSDTISGVDYTSVLYSTIGVPDGAGGRDTINPVNNQPTKTIESATARKAPFIPYIEVMDRAQHTTGLDLTGDTITLSIAPAQGTPSLIADNQFTLSWQKDTSGNGFLWGLFEDSAPTTPSAQINSTQMADYVVGNLAVDGGVFGYDVFADNTIDINSAVKIADLKYDPTDGATGSWEMSNIDGATGITLDPVAFNQDGAKPDIEVENAEFLFQGIFNPSNIPITSSDGSMVSENSTSGRSHSEPEEGALLLNTIDVSLGADLAQQSFIILGRANQATLGQFDGNPVRSNGVKNQGGTGYTLKPLQRFGTAFKLLGFSDVIVVNDSTTFDFVSDNKPFIQMDETSLHISIPELSGIISYEGEAENVSKTIKVIPKNEFTNSSTSEAMTFTSPFEEWIDINNAEPLVLNELTMQVRKPDGTMATNLKPITRATIKIQEDPEVKKLEAQRQMIEAMASTKAQSQNTGNLQLMNASSWVGS